MFNINLGNSHFDNGSVAAGEIEKQLERMDRVIGGERTAGGGRRGSALSGRKVPPNTVVPRLRLGQAQAQDHAGWLLRSKVGRNSTIF
jgi:hypothetical protein